MKNILVLILCFGIASVLGVSLPFHVKLQSRVQTKDASVVSSILEDADKERDLLRNTSRKFAKIASRLRNMTLSCQANNVNDFLASRGIVTWSWFSLYNSIETRKGQLLEATTADTVQDGKAREYLESHRNEMNYDECRHFFDLLRTGVDGKAKQWWIFGGGFKSPLVREWESIIEFYELRKLHLIELGVRVRRIGAQVKEAQVALNDEKSALVGYTEKVLEFDTLIARLRTELEGFGLCEISPAEAFADCAKRKVAESVFEVNTEIDELISSKELRNVLQEYNHTDGELLDGLLNKSNLRNVLQEYNHTDGELLDGLLNKSNLLHKTLVLVEEVLMFHKTRLFQDKHIYGGSATAVSLLEKARTTLNAACSLDPDKKEQKMLESLHLIERRITKSVTKRNALASHCDNQLKPRIAQGTERLNTLRLLRNRVISKLEEAIKKELPNGVSIQP